MVRKPSDCCSMDNFILTHQDFQSLCQRLDSHDSTLSIVNLSCNNHVGYRIVDEDARALAESLSNHDDKVTELYLNITKVSVRGAAFLMGWLIRSPSLEILSLQGYLENDDHVLVVDVLVRALLQNTKSPTLELASLPIARSTLLETFLVNSFISELFLASPCRLIVDTGDAVLLSECSFSETLLSIHIVSYVQEEESQEEDGNDGENGMTEWLLECSKYLPKLTILGLINCEVTHLFERFLSKNIKNLKEIQFLHTHPFHETKPANNYESIILCLQEADALERAYFNLSNIPKQQAKAICQAMYHNRSLVRVFETPIIHSKLLKYCERNQRFIEHWEDLQVAINISSLWPLAIAIAVQSARGRTALYKRLPLLFASSSCCL